MLIEAEEESIQGFMCRNVGISFSSSCLVLLVKSESLITLLDFKDRKVGRTSFPPLEEGGGIENKCF